jgi:hypothetical protein
MNFQEAVLCRAKREIFGREDPELARGAEARKSQTPRRWA